MDQEHVGYEQESTVVADPSPPLHSPHFDFDLFSRLLPLRPSTLGSRDSFIDARSDLMAHLAERSENPQEEI